MSVEIAAGPQNQVNGGVLGLDLRVRRVISETSDAISIEFDPEPGMNYQAGQFLTLRVPAPSALGGAVGRSYSLSSSPDVDTAMKVTVKRVEGGWGSNWLCDNAAAGSVLRVLPPAGTFVLDEKGSAYLFFAAGSGITPIISMLKSVLVRTEAPVFLFYANRDRGSVIFGEELDALPACHPGRLILSHWLTSERGRPSPDQMSALIPRLRGGEIAYVCGPQSFTAATEEILATAGVCGSQVRTETFSSMTGDPFARADSIETPLAEGATLVTVDLDGDVETVECPPQTSILDAILAAGIDPPYSCREGTCGSCLALLKEGEIEHRRALALSPEDEAAGYILPCQAIPQSAKLSVEF